MSIFGDGSFLESMRVRYGTSKSSKSGASRSTKGKAKKKRDYKQAGLFANKDVRRSGSTGITPSAKKTSFIKSPSMSPEVTKISTSESVSKLPTPKATSKSTRSNPSSSSNARHAQRMSSSKRTVKQKSTGKAIKSKYGTVKQGGKKLDKNRRRGDRK